MKKKNCAEVPVVCILVDLEPAGGPMAGQVLSAQGAEAKVYVDQLLGREVIVKERSVTRNIAPPCTFARSAH